MTSYSRIRVLLISLVFAHVYALSISRAPSPSIMTSRQFCNYYQSPSQLKMSITVDYPKASPTSDGMKNQSESSKLSAFRQKLERSLRQTSENKPRRRRSESKQPLSVVTMVDNLQDYKSVVAEERNKITVVRFYATWCKACRAIKPKFYQLSQLHPEVSFVEVPVTEQNSDLHQGLGIPSLPFGHIYHPDAGLVEEMKIGRASFGKFAKTMSWYADGFCQLKEVGDCSNPLSEE